MISYSSPTPYQRSSAPTDTSLRRLPNATPTMRPTSLLHAYRYIVLCRPSHAPILCRRQWPITIHHVRRLQTQQHGTSSPCNCNVPHRQHINNDNMVEHMVERACGCVPCVTCKRMFKGRGLSLHATRTGCGYLWFHMDGTTYDARWNDMMQTLPCKCAMK